MQMADEIPKGYRADSTRLRRVPVQMADEILEGSGADSKQSSGGSDADG